MEVIEKSKKKIYHTLWSHFPRGHMVAVGALCAGLMIVTALPSDRASARRNAEVIPIPALRNTNIEATLPAELFVPEKTLTVASDDIEPMKIDIVPGDSLSKLFKRAGMTDRKMLAFLNSADESKRLQQLYPGHVMEFQFDADGELASLRYIEDQLTSFAFVRDGERYTFEESNRAPDIQIAHSSGVIRNSLYQAGVEARLDDKLIMELADIFGWDIDFALDLRRGDRFKVAYQELFLDGEKIANGSIVAAEFINQGESYRAVRYVSTRGEEGYYTPDGKSMRKEFLRAPLDFRRISSNFNPARLHPILKTRRPHRGIDYAAARGTPVWASGRGRVIQAGYSKANGNFVVIQHGNNIQTKYLHLQRRFVKRGEKVKQKQRIGTVGSTGLATGPHLHYEFLISGVHRNPRTIVNKLPKAKSISHLELSRFMMATRDLTALLDQTPAPSQIARAENGGPETTL